MRTGLYLGEVPIGKVVVAVAGENGIQLQEKTVTPSKGDPIEVTPDIGIDGLSKVTVEPIPDAYVDTTTNNAPYAGDMLKGTIAFANTNKIEGALEDKDILEYSADGLSFENGDLIVSGTNAERAIIKAEADVSITVEGADLGNATAADVLNGKTFTSENGLVIEGTMPNNGSIIKTLDKETVSYSIPAGYTDGGTVSINTQTKEATPNTENQTIESDTGKVLSAVYVKPIPTDYVKPTSIQTAKIWTPTTSTQSISAGTYCSGKQTIGAIPSSYIKPTATQAAKTWTPTTSEQSIAAGTYCSGKQTIGAIPSSYVKPSYTSAGGTYTLAAGESLTKAAGTYLTSALNVTAAAGNNQSLTTGSLASANPQTTQYLKFTVATTDMIGFYVWPSSNVALSSDIQLSSMFYINNGNANAEKYIYVTGSNSDNIVDSYDIHPNDFVYIYSYNSNDLTLYSDDIYFNVSDTYKLLPIYLTGGQLIGSY